MSNGYGQIFLLLLGIGLILLAASGKGRQVWELFTAQKSLDEVSTPATDTTTKSPNQKVEDVLEEGDKAGSGHGGVVT